MAAEIEGAVGVSAVLIPGSKGIFDVKVDGDMLYSKYLKNDKHPAPGEIAALLAAR